MVGVAEALGLSTDWLVCGADVVAFAEVVAGLAVVGVAWGAVVVAFGCVVAGTDFALTTAVDVDGALPVAWAVT